MVAGARHVLRARSVRWGVASRPPRGAPLGRLRRQLWRQGRDQSATGLDSAPPGPLRDPCSRGRAPALNLTLRQTRRPSPLVAILIAKMTLPAAKGGMTSATRRVKRKGASGAQRSKS